MKVKNIMFFGFAAAILSMGAANAANAYTPVENVAAGRKIVASKAYVDQQANALATDIATVSTTAGAAVTHGNGAVGDGTHPVYIDANGAAQQATYVLGQNVPVTTAADAGKVLYGDGTWGDLPAAPTIDSALSTTSENAVQNKVVTNALGGKADVNLGNIDTAGQTVIDNRVVVKATDGTFANTATGANALSSTTLGTAVNELAAEKQNIQIGDTNDANKAVIVGSDGKITMSSATLKPVATSGDYSDLTNKPTIPTIGQGSLTVTGAGSGASVRYDTNDSDVETVTVSDVPLKPSTCTDTDPCVLMENATGYAWFHMVTDSGAQSTQGSYDGTAAGSVINNAAAPANNG